MAKKRISRNEGKVAIFVRVPPEVARKLEARAKQEQRGVGPVAALLLTQATATMP